MVKRSNEQWLAELRTGDVARDLALSELRDIIVNGLKHALTTWLAPSHPNFYILMDDVAQDTLLRVMQHLDDFEHRSQFTTWVHKIAVRVALTELRRRRWKDRSIDEMMDEHVDGDASMALADSTPGPAQLAERSDSMAYLMGIMRAELTQKQRAAMQAVAINGMPLEEAARRLGTERNALYKMLHDARLKLKKRLIKDGMSMSDKLSARET